MHFLLCSFFFSSRRRHTRLQGDWSSDVCSSDLWKRLAIFVNAPCWRSCTVQDLGSRKSPNSKRATSTALATCCGFAAAKDGRIDRLCCRPNYWNCCVAIGERGGLRAGCFPAPILRGPSLPKPCSWLAGKRGERQAFLNLFIRTC